MSDYPTGTVTFLFTDVVESSRLWEQHHDAMRLAMATHDEIVRDAIASSGGMLVKLTGDGAFAVFASALDAVTSATAIQDALDDASWDPISRLPLRVGVHTGEAELRDGDYFGASVNRAARVTSIAAGGEVLVSLTTQEVVRDRLSEGLALRDLGERDLRGFSRPEHVFALVADNDDRGEEPAAPPQASAPDGDEEQARRAAWIAVPPTRNTSPTGSPKTSSRHWLRSARCG